MNLNQSQAEFEVEFFRRVLSINGRNLEVLRRQAELLSRQGEHEAALRLDRRLAELLPDCCIAHYNLACSLALCGCFDEAVASLERALILGYHDFAHLEADSDLEPLQSHAGFLALMQKHGLTEK